jgi:hypothetical protein
MNNLSIVGFQIFIKDDFDGTCCSSNIALVNSFEFIKTGDKNIDKLRDGYEVGVCNNCGSRWERDLGKKIGHRTEILECSDSCGNQFKFAICKKCSKVVVKK